eukprot:sb/3461822/
MVPILFLLNFLTLAFAENVHLIPFNTKNTLQAGEQTLFISYKSIQENPGSSLLFSLNGDLVKSGKHAILVGSCAMEPPLSSITDFQSFLMSNCQSVSLISTSNKPCLSQSGYTSTIVSVVYVDSATDAVEFEATAFKNFLVASVQATCNTVHSKVTLQSAAVYQDYILSGIESEVSLGTLTGAGCSALGVWSGESLLGSANHLIITAGSGDVTIRCLTGSVITPALFFASSGDFKIDFSVDSFTPPVIASWPIICNENNTIQTIAEVPETLFVTGFTSVPVPGNLIACPSDLSALPSCGGSLFPLLTGSSLTLPEGSAVQLGDISNSLILKSESSTCVTMSVSDTPPTFLLEEAIFAYPGGTLQADSPHLSVSCPYSAKTGVTIVSYRSHTHSHGTSVSLWIERGTHWIVALNTTTPNTITELETRVRVMPGDVLHTRCDYTIDRSYKIGSDEGDEEMCNLYLYYLRGYTESGEGLSDCFRTGEFTAPEVHDLSSVERNPFAGGPALSLVKKEKRERGDFAIVAMASRSDLLFSISLELTVNLTTAAKLGNSQVITDKVLTVQNTTSGATLSDSGENRFYLPCGVFVGDSGEVLIPDLVLNQVFLFPGTPISPSYVPSLVLGTEHVSGNTSTTFCQPTSATLDDLGFIYVGDGLCGGRVVKFVSDGTFLGEFGALGGERGVSGVFGEVTAIAFDMKRKVLLILDNVHLQLQVLDTRTGGFIRLFDLHKYLNVDGVVYSRDMDAIIILACYGLECQVIVLDPITGGELAVTGVGDTRHLTSITTLPNNTVVLGSQTNELLFYEGHDVTTVQDQGNLKDVSPLIHYYLPRPGSLNETEERAISFIKEHRFWAGVVMVTVVCVVLVLIVVVVIRARRRRWGAEYQTLQGSDSEDDDESTVIYRNEERRRMNNQRETLGL